MIDTPFSRAYNRAPMIFKEKIPDKINPFHLAEAETILQGVVFIGDLQRLRGSLVDDQGEVKVEVQFGIDRNGVRHIKGHWQTELKLQCQRCMEPFTYGIMGDFLSGVVKTEEEAKELSEVYDPVFEVDGMIAIQDIIEDELIISLPIVPVHDAKDCKVDLSKVVMDVNQASEMENNPFKVIEILRTKNRSKE
jgi:uncharacterized protein